MELTGLQHGIEALYGALDRAHGVDGSFRWWVGEVAKALRRRPGSPPARACRRNHMTGALGVRSRTGPEDAAAPHSRLANDAVSPRTNSPCDQLGSNGTTVCQVNLTGRATGAPFSTVKVASSGQPGQYTVTATCATPSVAGHRPVRSGFASKGSIGRGVYRSCRNRPAEPVPGRGGPSLQGAAVCPVACRWRCRHRRCRRSQITYPRPWRPGDGRARRRRRLH